MFLRASANSISCAQFYMKELIKSIFCCCWENNPHVENYISFYLYRMKKTGERKKKYNEIEVYL